MLGTRLPPYLATLRSYKKNGKWLSEFDNKKLIALDNMPKQDEFKGYKAILDVIHEDKKITIKIWYIHTAARELIVAW
jgi:hypothetical protein